MKLTDILERYAVLMNLSDRSVVLYRHSLAKLGEFVGHEPTLADLDDFTIAKFLRWRATNTRGKKPISPESVAKDRSQILALWNWSCRKKIHAGEWPALAPAKAHSPDAASVHGARRWPDYHAGSQEEGENRRAAVLLVVVNDHLRGVVLRLEDRRVDATPLGAR